MNAPRPATQPDFELTPETFRAVAKLLHDFTGIALEDSKQHLVYSRLSRRLRALKLGYFEDYLKRVAADPREKQEFCNALTTNLTFFFRETHHFDYLATTVLPGLLKRNAASRRIRIWSAGCSSGEEPYSIAIVVREVLGNLPDWDVRILATDIDSHVLSHACAGVYGEDRFEKMSPARRVRWFESSRNGRDHIIRPELKKLVSFKPLNLIEPWPMKGPFDVIFCRNVVIYFKRSTQATLFANMAHLQRPGDHLFIGHSESLFNVNQDYDLAGQTIYVRGG